MTPKSAVARAARRKNAIRTSIQPNPDGNGHWHIVNARHRIFTNGEGGRRSRQILRATAAERRESSRVIRRRLLRRLEEMRGRSASAVGDGKRLVHVVRPSLVDCARL